MAAVARSESLHTLPTDEMRQLMWRLPGRPPQTSLLAAIAPVLRRYAAAAWGEPSEHQVRSLQREEAIDRLVDVWAAGEATASLEFAVARLPQEQPEARVLGLALQLWTAGPAAAMLREASALAGGGQIEGTTDVETAMARHQLAAIIAGDTISAQLEQWTREMRGIANTHAGTGACTLSSAMQLWQWTVKHFHKEPASTRRVAYPLAEALCWLLAARAQILDVLELDARVTHSPALTGAFPGYVSFFTNLSHVQAARASGETGRLCAELVYGYNRHPSWDDACATGCCGGEEVDAYDALFPGFAATSRVYLDVVESDGSHAAKAGPCARFPGLQRFQQLRAKLDGCLTGNRLARDLAVEALSALHPGVPDHAA